MVVDLGLKNKTFKIIFDNDIDIDYRLHDSELAEKWASKIKHLQNVPIDSVESCMEDVSDIRELYAEFCKFANIEPINIVPLDQGKLNQLHRIYEEHHDRLSRLKDNTILYKLHHSVHFHEGGTNKKNIKVGWGTYEGILTKQFKCYNFYEDSIIKNYIYLPWAELGKTPVTYWKDKEPNDQTRFNQLAKPHTTFRAMFFIATEDKVPSPLNTEFVEWFKLYKEEWFAYHGIPNWNNILEQSAPLLATTDYKGNMKDFKFNRIIL